VQPIVSVRSALGLLVAAAILLLTGCGPDTAAVPADGGGPVRGGTLTYAIDAEPTCFDIHASQQDVTAAVLRNVFDSLVAQDDAGHFHPWLATSWDITDGLRTYTFHLRHGVTFTDGSAFDAAAVRANFAHIVAKQTRSQYAASLLGPYAGTDVVDLYTVRVRFNRPFAPFLQAASTTYLGFYSPKVLATDAARLCAGGPRAVGTGPFSITSRTRGQRIVLTRNPAYDWAPATARHSGPAYLDRIVIRILKENSIRVGALTSGQVDVAAVPPADARTVGADRNLRLLRKDVPGIPYGLYLNTSLAPFTDRRVRTAIQRGINVDRDVGAVYFGQYRRAWGPLTDVTPSYDATVRQSWPYDPVKAGQLLDEAGWARRDGAGFRVRNGRRLSISWPVVPTYLRDQRDVLGQAIQADLRKLGVEITRPSLDVGTYLALSYGNKAQMLDFSWSRADPDVLRLFFNSASSPASGGQNMARLADAEVDRLTVDGAESLDRTARDDLYGRVQHDVLASAAVVPLYTPSSIMGVARRVDGIGVDPNAWPVFFDAWRVSG